MICDSSRNFNTSSVPSQNKINFPIIKSIARVLKKLLRHFNGTIISTSFMLLSYVSPVIFSLKLNESVTLATLKATITPLFITDGLSLQY